MQPGRALNIVLLVLAAALIHPGRTSAQIPFGISPGWISANPADYSTGAAWADINRDGRPDLVIANGNDMGRQHVVVYYNAGTGTLPTTPGWQSADIDYHGQLSIGDVNGDGYPDVAVSVYIGPGGFSTPGRVKLYMNIAGSLEITPSWTSRDSFYTFSCAFGDADGDGDPDLAVAAGEAYGSRPERNRIYYNRNGVLDSLPGWKSSEAGYSYDAAWSDFDVDGDLDLVFACEAGPNRMYRNDGDSIRTAPVWVSADSSRYANSLFVADVNNDGLPDLAVSDNRQLGGEGRFKIYMNNAGSLSSMPSWSSSAAGYGSGITLADIDGDGWRDLIAGGWWEPLRIYRNVSGTFPALPDWTSATGSVVETIVCADVDADGLDTVTVTVTGDGVRRIFTLPRAPFQVQPVVYVGSDSLTAAAYWCDTETGVLSLAVPPGPGVQLIVRTIVSHDLDFAVSNWDNSLGNYLFFNTSPGTGVGPADGLPAGFVLEQNYPNPFNAATTIRFHVPGGTVHALSLRIIDILGLTVATLVDGPVEPGRHSVVFDASGLPSGVYFYEFRTGAFSAVRSMVLLK
jgi:hypothetical protein